MSRSSSSDSWSSNSKSWSLRACSTAAAMSASSLSAANTSPHGGHVILKTRFSSDMENSRDYPGTTDLILRREPAAESPAQECGADLLQRHGAAAVFGCVFWFFRYVFWCWFCLFV